MKKTITIIIVVLVIAAAGVGGFFYFKKNQTVHNNDNAIGNTAGNLINGGLFCEYNDKIYFANPDDYNKLYVMNSELCSPFMKLSLFLSYQLFIWDLFICVFSRISSIGIFIAIWFRKSLNI